MTLAYSDIAITLIVVGVVLFAAWRLGQVNPVGTGKLAKRLGAVELKVAEQGERIGGVEVAMTTMADSQVQTAREVGAMRMEIAGDRGLAERTWSSVSRLENHFIEEAFRARRGDE